MVDKTVENCAMISKIKLELDIILKNMYTKFPLVSATSCNENERKLEIIRICLCQIGITLLKIALP